MGEDAPRERLTWIQRTARRRVRRAARRSGGEPLTPEDWEIFFELATAPAERRLSRILRTLPASPRCGICGAPFAGVGGRLLRPLGYRQSRKSPSLCDVCVEASPPGGMTMETGVLFADIRGFTGFSERADPAVVSDLLHRFYAAAESVLFPEAVIDKLIGDEVMALYLPFGDTEEPAPLMLDHARRLLAAVGYGGAEPPFAEVGVGLDLGEAFVGNVGGGSYNEFTAIGDVVNVASRLQGAAAGGEIVASARLVERLERTPRGEPVELELKGREEAVAAYRIVAAT